MIEEPKRRGTGLSFALGRQSARRSGQHLAPRGALGRAPRLRSLLGSLLLGSLVIVACKQEPAPSVQEPPRVATPEVTPRPTPAPKVAAPARPPDPVGDGAPAAIDPVRSEETGEAPRAEEATPAVDAALLLTLGDGVPGAASVIERQVRGRHELVLYRLFPHVAWQRRQAEAGVDDAWDKLVDAAEACDPAASSLSCAVGLTDDVYLQWALLGDPVHALELARVAREEAGPRIVAKVRLYDVAHDAHAPDPELGMERKLKVYDMDLDGRAEVLLIVPLALPCESELDQEEGALGLVFDLEALHLQFATTRAYHFLFQDVSSSETLAQSRFRAVKGVGGHPDLEVRETVLKRYEGGEDEDSDGGSSRERSARETTCVYDVPGDRWACPEPLGAQLIEVVDGELSFGRQDP